jgi:hypothetical protein
MSPASALHLAPLTSWRFFIFLSYGSPNEGVAASANAKLPSGASMMNTAASTQIVSGFGVTEITSDPTARRVSSTINSEAETPVSQLAKYAHRFAADGEILLGTKFFRQVRIVEALIFAAGQAQDQLLLGNGNGPGHGTSAIAMLYSADGIELITAFKTMYLAFTRLQQPGGFAYAQPPARRILDYFHPLKLFHRHHPDRVTKSRCS